MGIDKGSHEEGFGRKNARGRRQDGYEHAGKISNG